MIRYLKHNEIDKQKWDACINASINKLIYAYSWYLDIVCPGWDALVLDDYKAVMPLPWNKKYGIRYVYQPFFTQQLGVFGKEMDIKHIDGFIELMNVKFKFVEYCLNYKNDYHKRGTYNRINQILPLHLSYSDIYNKYSTSTKRNIRDAYRSQLKYDIDINEDTFLSLLKKHPQNYLNNKANLIIQKLLLEGLTSRKLLRGVRNTKDELITAIFFHVNRDRLFPHISINSVEGKRCKAFYFLIDAIIKETAGKNTILDFAGSNIQGVNFFNKGFGSIIENYTAYKVNNLPFFIKWIKR